MSNKKDNSKIDDNNKIALKIKVLIYKIRRKEIFAMNRNNTAKQ
jgi:hypothetical protein